MQARFYKYFKKIKNDFILLGWDISLMYLPTFFVGIVALFCGSGRSFESLFVQSLPASLVFVVPALFFGRFRKAYYAAVWLLFFPVFIITISNLTLYSAMPTADTFAPMLETNPSEAADFLKDYTSAALVFCIALGVSLLALLFRYAQFEPVSRKTVMLAAPLCACAAVWALNSGQLFSRDFYVSSAVLSYFDYVQQHKELEECIRNADSKNIVTVMEDDAPKTLVVVIGESLTRNHMQIYGYPRRTTPLLAKEPDLFVFRDVISPHAHTIAVLQKAFTFKNWEQRAMHQTIIQALNGAGYKTFWYSNQPSTGAHDTAMTLLAHGANEKWYSSQGLLKISEQVIGESSLDSCLLPKLKQALADPAPHKVIFLHLMGNHSSYNERFPSEMPIFYGSPPYLNKALYSSASRAHQREILSKTNEYDTAVRFNDQVVFSFLQQARVHADQDIAFLYFSDHGDEIFEEKDFNGHNELVPTRNMFEIPFILWASPLAKHRLPALSASHLLSRRYQTDDLIHSLMQLAGIRNEFYDPSRSIFSSRFVARERFVSGKEFDTLYPPQKVQALASRPQ